MGPGLFIHRASSAKFQVLPIRPRKSARLPPATAKYFAAPEFWTVGHAIDHARDNADALPDEFFEVYVIDPAHRLKGQVPLATLLEREHPAALKFALALLGFMQPATRLPIVQLGTAAKAEVAQAMAALADEYLAAAQ